jgi:hypothetical protein
MAAALQLRVADRPIPLHGVTMLEFARPDALEAVAWQSYRLRVPLEALRRVAEPLISEWIDDMRCEQNRQGDWSPAERRVAIEGWPPMAVLWGTPDWIPALLMETGLARDVVSAVLTRRPHAQRWTTWLDAPDRLTMGTAAEFEGRCVHQPR